MTFLALLLLAAAPDLHGRWQTPSGVVVVTASGDAWVGALEATSPACPLPAGTEVLRGALVDDSLSAQARLCLVASGCAATEGNAFALLLLGAGNQSLQGGVHGKAACAKKATPLVLKRLDAVVHETPKANVALDPNLPPPLTLAPAVAKERLPVGDVAPGVYDPRAAKASPSKKARAILSDGENYLKEGYFERARERFLEAVKIAPGLPEAYNGVGVTYAARRDFVEALAWYKKSLTIDPDFGDGVYNMACAYSAQGQIAPALAYLKLAAEKGFTDRDVIEKDEDLAPLRDTNEYKAILLEFGKK